MRALLPEPSDDVDLHDHYGRNWVEHGGVRVNFIASVDGSATSAGESRGLQTPGDNAVFAALRDLADVILVGASTATREGYRPARVPADRAAIRTSRGFSSAPATAVVSASLDLDLDAALYREADQHAPTYVITGSSAPLAARNDIIDLAGEVEGLRLLEVPSTDGGVDFTAVVAQLRELGLRRILCEGGPRIFATAALARAVDELCLTISPMLAGPAGPKIVGGHDWPADFLPQLHLDSLLIEDDALFSRYLVR